MENTMEWLYFHYILPALEEEPQGEYTKNIQNLDGILDIPQKMDLEMAVEFYASTAFRLGLRTGLSLSRLLADE